MKIRKIFLVVSTILALGLVSCNDFLDKMPDKRTTLNSPEKVRQVLVSAYPTLLPNFIFEYMSDNTTDNGDMYSFNFTTAIQAFEWRDITDNSWDTPAEVWEYCYKAISSANHAIEAIENLGYPDECIPMMAEALLCRAYAHFVLVNTFCIAYNPVSSGTDLGIPYSDKPEKVVSVNYDRSTVAEVYKKIDKDIEDALPYITDNYQQPKYHFNYKAAHAFAARFNLFYGNYDRVIKYATLAIGENPSGTLRNIFRYREMTNSSVELSLEYHRDTEPCNLILIVCRGLWGRGIWGAFGNRYGHNLTMANTITVRSEGPWGRSLDAYSSYVFGGSNQLVYSPKNIEMFEYTNRAARIGQPRFVCTEFTTDETLLCRAEAYAMTEQFDKAARDLSYWYSAKMRNPMIKSADEINDFYKDEGVSTDVRVPFESRFVKQGASEMQVNMLHACLHARRIERIHEGSRWMDIKRHGLTISHVGVTPSLKPYDPRTAIQIPSDALSAGMQPNDRSIK